MLAMRVKTIMVALGAPLHLVQMVQVVNMLDALGTCALHVEKKRQVLNELSFGILPHDPLLALLATGDQKQAEKPPHWPEGQHCLLIRSCMDLQAWQW